MESATVTIGRRGGLERMGGGRPHNPLKLNAGTVGATGAFTAFTAGRIEEEEQDIWQFYQLVDLTVKLESPTQRAMLLLFFLLLGLWLGYKRSRGPHSIWIKPPKIDFATLYLKYHGGLKQLHDITSLPVASSELLNDGQVLRVTIGGLDPDPQPTFCPPLGTIPFEFEAGRLFYPILYRPNQSFDLTHHDGDTNNTYIHYQTVTDQHTIFLSVQLPT